eukprot:9320802-Prorocentrum_lima.AAC.1
MQEQEVPGSHQVNQEKNRSCTSKTTTPWNRQSFCDSGHGDQGGQDPHGALYDERVRCDSGGLLQEFV